MNNYFLLVLLPNIDCFFGIIGFLGVIASIIGALIYMNENRYWEEEDSNKFKKNIFKVFISSILMLFITCFMPTKKDILELKIISVVSNLKGVDKIPQKLIDRLSELLDSENKDETK